MPGELLLSDSPLQVVASDVGGTCGRKLIFATRTGAVFVKSLRSSHDVQEDLRPSLSTTPPRCGSP